MTSSYLVRAGEVMASDFPFVSWASANRFTYPAEAEPSLRVCGSAAEAYFVRAFFTRTWSGERPALSLQVPCLGFRIDVVVTDARGALAIEIDGMAFHHRSREQVAADYLRERRIVARGYTVIRFTAPEVFGNADECWRQVEVILAARGTQRATQRAPQRGPV